MKKLIICLIGIVFLFGCASLNQSSKGKAFTENMNRAVGTMTFDDAIRTWGEPTSVTQGDKIISATWINSKEGTKHTTAPGGFLEGFYQGLTQVSHGEKLQLIFDKSTKVMTNWSYERW